MAKFGMIVALPFILAACVSIPSGPGENNVLRAQFEVLRAAVDDNRVGLLEANRRRRAGDTELDKQLDNLDGKIERQEVFIVGKMEQALAGLEHKIDAKLDDLVVRANDLGSAMNGLQVKIDSLEVRVVALEAELRKELDNLERKFGGRLDRHDDYLDGELDRLDRKISRTGEELHELEGKYRVHTHVHK